METTINNDPLIERVISLLNEGKYNDEKIIKTLESEFSFTEDCDAEIVLELIKTGLFRATFIAGGQTYPKNNLSDNLIVNAAIKIGLEKIEIQALLKKDIVENKSWWKFW